MSRKMRILFVCSSMTGGGAEQVVLHLLRTFDREKFVLELALFSATGSLYPNVPADVPIHSLEGLGAARSVLQLRRRLLGLIHDSRIDVMNCHMAESSRAVVRALIGTRRPPIALVEHAVPSRYMGEKGGWLRRMAFRLETAFLYRQANVVVAVSAGVGREVRSLYGIPQQRIRVIRNGVQRRPALEETRSPLSQIISAGRLVQVKGLDVLLRAFAIVRKKADSQLVIFGEGPERGALQSLAEALAVAPYVRFPGFVPDFWSHLGADALFVLSSRSESSSLVLVEAMQRGLPVVSTRCPYGPEEVIHDGIDGLLVPIDDPASLAQALLRLLSNQAEARMLAAAGRRAVLQYSVEAMVCEYQNLLLGLGASRLDESGEKL